MRLMHKMMWAFLAITLGSNAWATKIGFVDTRRILRESAPSRAAEKQLREEFASRLQNVRTLENQISALEAKMDAVGMSEDSYKERHDMEQKYNQLSNELRAAKRESSAALDARRSQEYQRIIGLANEAVRRVADADHYDAILQEAVYVNKSVDITDKVLGFLKQAPSSAPVPAKALK